MADPGRGLDLVEDPGRPGSSAAPPRDRLSRSERLLVALELVLAVGALAGGGGMLLDTSGHGQGLPSNLLNGTPFTSLLIPGILLLLLNGVFPIVVAVLAIRRRPIALPGHLGVALVLVAWIAGEAFFIGLASWMQPFFFAYALAIGLLALCVPPGAEGLASRSRPRGRVSLHARVTPRRGHDNLERAAPRARRFA